MQHCVLSEGLSELGKQLGRDIHLLFATSHSMAPWSVPRSLASAGEDYSRSRFDRARTRLDRPNATSYEIAWEELSCENGLPYPSSANLAVKLWEGPLSLSLSEVDISVAGEIDGWLALPEVRARLASNPGNELRVGDWRDTFAAKFGNPSGVRAIYAEMDPMRFEHHAMEMCSRDNRAVVYVEDLETIAIAFNETNIPVVLQMSSFSANNNNPHRIVEPVISTVLGRAAFCLRGRVEADGNMICLVYARNLDLWEDPQELQRRYSQWAALI
jgi:hypothetical protein